MASPKAGAGGVTGAGNRSFQASTLNELYRGFRVGDVVTEPNPEHGRPHPGPDRQLPPLLRPRLRWDRGGP